MKRPVPRKSKIPPPAARRPKYLPTRGKPSWLAEHPTYFERNHGPAPKIHRKENIEDDNI